ncbi:hypothetical protein PR048_014107 [Dryococelus australis]|uniref:ShKT domain-containing protein n=1 Tax=Dryococelus australis TaxID=614101 RepID=A0ABQ9HDF1_9NEOP|nr:hypothetical protein PR048_014107 [Dryococelus australis]
MYAKFAVTALPYWSQGAEKQYYISKYCANNETCLRTRNKYRDLCTHIWYQDWKCSECCRGDRCNYYVFVSVFHAYLLSN